MRLLKFEAEWCVNCKQVGAVLDTIDLPFHVECVDIDKNVEAAMHYGIRGIPHLILLDDNDNIVTRVGGVLSKQKLMEAFKLI